jgi:hypothetical protein
MDKQKQHNVHDHLGQRQLKEDQSQRNTTSHAVHAAMDHSVQTMSNHSAHATHQGRVMPIFKEMIYEERPAFSSKEDEL